MTSRCDSFGTGTCTYDGDVDDDSFQTAACSMYSGFSSRHAIIVKENVNAERLDRTIQSVCSEDLRSMDDKFFIENKHPINDFSDDSDDENLSYITEIEIENKRDKAFLFTAESNLRLDIMSASSQSLMSFDTTNTVMSGSIGIATMDTDQIPDLFSCSTGSHPAMNSSLLCSGTSFPDLFASFRLPTIRETKFQSIPVKSSFFDMHRFRSCTGPTK